MKIVVISDTHVPDSADGLPPQLYPYLKECDLIVHAGDIVEMSLIKELRKLKETRAVWGNMDSPEVKQSLPEKILFEVCGKTIGVIHGKGAPVGVLKVVKKAFDKIPDILIFGHSHSPMNEKIDQTLFFNPGSVNDRIFAPYRSFGVIEIEGDQIQSEIVRIKD